MGVREKLVEIVKRAAYSCLPSNTRDFHIDMFVTDLLANGVTVQKDCKACAEATQNCIVKLQEQIAELRSAQEWISVKDRLPKAGAIVLCYTEYFVEVLQWDERADMWVDNYRSYRKNYVTHWMPLPQPPKGE